tara:strand:- start:106 stop:948 length:843 start_codon:yes stop_codon:yes gene_type:complete
MNTGAKIVIGLGILIIIVGIIMVATGDSFEDNVEEGIIYEGADGNINVDNVEPNTGSKYIVHLIDVKFEGGGDGGYNEAHGNSTWNLTQSDCDLVKSFSLSNGDNQIFYPRCNYVADDVSDKYITIGRLCNDVIHDRYGNEKGHKGEGCRAGTYTWDTDGNQVMVYDVEVLLGAIFEEIMKWLGSFGACCCGSIVLLIGILMAAFMEEGNSNPYVQQTGGSDSNNQTIPQSSGGWEDQKDYIHREKEEEIPDKSEMATTEDKKEEKKRSGEYELPPPPEI